MIDELLQLLLRITGNNILIARSLLGVVVTVAVLIAGKVVKWLLNTVGRRIIAQTETDLDDKILDIVNSRVIAISFVTGISLGIRQVRSGLTQENDTILSFFGGADTVLYLITVVIIASVVTRIVRTVMMHMMQTIAERQQNTDFEQTLAPLANRVITFTIIAFTAIVVLEHFGQSVTSLLTILGAGSLALGLAAQDTISNMISGFIIMIDRPFRTGDRIRIPSGEVGDVHEIGLRSTRILDFDNNLLIVPNSELIKTKIVNYAYPGGDIRVLVEVSVAYGTDVDEVKSLLTSAAAAQPEVLVSPAPEAYLSKFGDSGLLYTVVCRVSEYRQQAPVAERIRVRIYRDLAVAGIEIPFPHHVLLTRPDDGRTLHTAAQRKTASRKDRRSHR